MPDKIFYLPDYKEDEQISVEWDYDPKQLDVEFTDQIYLTPIHMKGVVEKGKDTFFFRGNLQAQTEQTCGRCLIQIKHPVVQSFDLIYETADKLEIDPTEDIREAIMIDHPIAYVCKMDCKGLCPQCGVNLNEEKCSCDPEINNKSLAQLKEIWDKKKK